MKTKDEYLSITEPLNGFNDICGQEARIKNFLANRISQVFQEWGYDQIIFPIIEKSSCFSERVVGGSPWPEWDKCSIFYINTKDYHDSYFDLPKKNDALLIPEGTISVSRWLAKSLVNKRIKVFFPKKVFYITPCYRNELVSKISSTKKREFTQVGIEILGSNSFIADIEILLLIHEGFKTLGIDSKMELIRLGNVEIFNALCRESAMDNDTRIILKNKMDIIAEARAGKEPERLQPEIKNVMKIVKNLKLTDKLIKKWNIMTNTYKRQLDEQTINTLGYKNEARKLNKMAKILTSYGVNCVIDLSVVRSHEYYTGIVYEIDLKFEDKVFVEVAGGGRYNRLISKFLAKRNYQIPAVGFAYGLERICEYFRLISKNLNKKISVDFWVDKENVDVVILLKSKTAKNIIKVINLANNLRREGKRVDIFVGDDQLKSEEYAKNLHADLIII